MPENATEIHVAVSNAAFAHAPVSRDTHPMISSWCAYSFIKSQVFPAVIGRNLVSPAHGGRQRLHVDESRLRRQHVHAGTTWRRSQGAWGPEININRTDVYIIINSYIFSISFTEIWISYCSILWNQILQIIRSSAPSSGGATIQNSKIFSIFYLVRPVNIHIRWSYPTR